LKQLEDLNDCGCGEGVSRVVISGATGLLGRAIHKEMFINGYPHLTVVGLTKNRYKPDSGLRVCDLTDFEALEKLFLEEKPNVFIHAAAERRPDIAEKNQAYTTEINLSVTKKISDLCVKYKCWMLFISTNAVFDGKNPPYAPNAKPAPLSHYGRTKAEAEDYLRATSEPGILRLPVLYGPVEYPEESSLTIIAKQVLAQVPVSLDHYTIYSPTFVDDVARCVHKILHRKEEHCTLQGTWHFSAEERFTKYELGVLMGELRV